MNIDLRAMAQHGLLTVGFCALIAVALTLAGRGHWDVQLVYSLGIGLVAWLVIDLGRFWLTRGQPDPWPPNWRGPALVVVGVAAGFAIGSVLGNAYSRQVHGLPGLLERQNLLSVLIITAAATVAMSLFFYQRGKANHWLAEKRGAERDAAEARLRLLQSQLEPHMLFNTLANLRALIETDAPRAIDMLDRLNRFLRATLAASRSRSHPLGEEFARLHDYLELMAVRMGPRLRHTLDLPAALAEHPLPPLLLQPLVENSIRHGLEPQVRGGEIRVSARAEGPHLWLEVSDSGVGCPQPQDGFGLTQVRERLLNTYGEHATLHWHSQPGQGTCVRLQLPLQPPLQPPQPVPPPP